MTSYTDSSRKTLTFFWLVLSLSFSCAFGSTEQDQESVSVKGDEKREQELPQVPAPEQLPAAVQENPLCAQIAQQNLTTLPRAADPSMGDSIQDAYAFYNFLTETISNPQAHDQRKRAFKILACAEHAKREQEKTGVWLTKTFLDQTTVQDLNLLAGSKENSTTYLANILSKGRTHTELGRAYLCGLLARPTTDVVLLKARQQIVKKLVENEALFTKLDVLLQELAAHETLFTGLWGTELLMQFVENGYSKMDTIGPVINESSLCLELGSLVQFGMVSFGVAIQAISPVVLTAYGVSLLARGKSILDDYVPFCLGQAGLLVNNEKLPSLRNRWTQGIVALCVGAAAAFSLKNNVQRMHTWFLFDDFLRRRLVHVAQYEQIAYDINELMAHDMHELCSSFTFAHDIEGFFGDQMKNDAQLEHLDSLLKSGTFEKDSEKEFSLLFSRGRMLCAYYLLGKIKQKFETLMAGLGELDAFLTLAKLIKESKTGGAQFCFPTYLTDKVTPSIQLVDFWNPFIDREKVVTNSIDLGNQHGVPNLVVTGPNSAGKSTILKSIALAILLAQSLGIAPAKAMAFTPFSYVVTYMNVADSIVDQESRFQAEARRVFEYGDRLKHLAANHEFSFALFDEIFSGTSPVEGASLGYKVAKILGTYSNCMTIIATHFKELTNLEADTNKRFLNYSVAVQAYRDGSIYLDEQNKIQRLFTLMPGISHQHIAREVFKEKGMLTQSPFFEQCFAE